MLKYLLILLVAIAFAFSEAKSNSSKVYVLSSSKESFKVQSGDFVLNFGAFEKQRKMAIYYLGNYPHSCLGTLGQCGPSFDYFNWAKEVKIIGENETSLSIEIKGEKKGYWTYTACFTFFRSFPGLFRLKIITKFLQNLSLEGEKPQFLGVNQKGEQIPVVQPALISKGHGFMPLVVNIEDRWGNYYFSVTWMELSGRESVYGVLKKGFKFHIDDSSFGLLSPSGTISPGKYVSADYLVYAWRDPLDNCSGMWPFLKAVTHILGPQITGKDYEESVRMASNVVRSLLHPKCIEDIYAKGPTGMGLKAFVGNPGPKKKEHTQFVTNVDVLLGAAYYYVKTKDDEAKKLCELIVHNMENFDGYYIADKGFYGAGWRQTGNEPMDPWGFVGCPLMLLCAHKLMPEVIPIDLQKMKSHAKRLIFVAKAVGYDFPISVFPMTGKTDRSYHGHKKWDVSILHAKFMMEMYNLTGESRYVQEATIALSHYMKHNYGKMCGSNTDVAGLGVALSLYEITNDQTYLNYFKSLCYQLVRWFNLYRGTFVDKEIPFTLVPNGLGSYSAAFEYGFFRYLLEEPYEEARSLMSKHPKLSSFLDPYFVLCDFYITFSPYCARYAFPRILGLSNRPAEGGKIDEDYWIPIEDLRPVWDREPWEFTRGQQIYGAGSQIIALMPRRK